MDQSTLVDDEITDGRRFIERFAADGNPIDAAAWIKPDEGDPWFLCIATGLYDREGPLAAYRIANMSLVKVDDVLISLAQLTLISPGNPIARDLRELALRHPKRSGFHLRVDRLGSRIVERAYLYSPRVFASLRAGSMTVEDISQEILRLLMRGPGVVQSSHVTLRDGTGFDGRPLTLHHGNHDTMTVEFVAEQEITPRVYPISAIASID